MYTCLIGFLIGITILQFFNILPSLLWLIVASVIWLPVFWLDTSRGKRLFCFMLWLLLGCSYATYTAQTILHWRLPDTLENKTITITGSIASLPHLTPSQADFEVNLLTIDGKAQRTELRLSWYHYPPNIVLTAGAVWCWQVRLKKPHGLANPGSFDYEKWLFSRHIRATGYIISGYLLQPTSRFSLASNDRLRENLQQRIQHELANENTAGLITALVMGAQNGITEQQWQVMRATGTNHLMAIAGVHIGFVAGFFYIVVNFLWRRCSYCLLRLPAQIAAAGAALIAAVAYSALAGFALPTQRALLMLSIFTLGLFFRRQLSAWNGFALALWLILIITPFTTFSVSFWLSFGAVFAILYGIGGRVNPSGWWWQYARVQWVITLALLPITLALFQQMSLVAFVANLFAVPAVGFLVLPPSLLGAVALYIWQPAGHWLLLGAAKIITVIWWLLAQLAHWPYAVWQQNFSHAWILIATVVAILLMLAPKGLPLRWLGIIWLLPVFYYHSPTPVAGEVWLTLLDVGQGLSAVVRTQHHTLVYDTGPKLGLNDDAGNRVILPFLHTVAVKQLDMLMISHGDSDHIGGAFSLLAQMPVRQVLTSVPERFPEKRAQLCQAGQLWQWDGITFQVLYPPPALLHQNNNSSCVLSISQKQHHLILLTGDIEKPAENYLLQQNLSVLPATVIVAPHHGSITSSTVNFVEAVKAQYVLFPVGYLNRYHFPSAIVLQRYRALGAIPLDTVTSGAISVQINAKGEVTQMQGWRQQNKRIW